MLQTRLTEMFSGSDMRGISAAIASISAVGIAIGISFPLLSLLMETRGVPASLIGANTAMAGIAGMVVVPFTTPIARMFGVINTLVAGILVSVVSLVGFYLTDNLVAWFVLRFIYSGAITILFILSEFWINSSANELKRGLILGIYGSILSLGFAGGPAILAVVGIDGFLPFMIGGGLIASAIVPVFLARKSSPPMDAEGNTPSIIPYLFIVPLATMAGFVFGAAEQTQLSLLPVYATRSGYEEATAAFFLTVVGLGNVALQIPLGIWSDKTKDRRSVLLFCTLCGVAGAILLPFVIQIGWLALVVLFLYGGIISGMYTVGLAHLGSKMSGTDLAQANAAFVLCYGFGMALGPQLTGVLMDLMGANGFAVGLFTFFAVYTAVYVLRAFQRQ